MSLCRRKARKSPDMLFGNEVYSVQFQSSQPFTEFGCKYIFKLHDVVDCPEFLLQKSTLVRSVHFFKYSIKSCLNFSDKSFLIFVIVTFYSVKLDQCRANFLARRPHSIIYFFKSHTRICNLNSCLKLPRRPKKSHFSI